MGSPPRGSQRAGGVQCIDSWQGLDSKQQLVSRHQTGAALDAGPMATAMGTQSLPFLLPYLQDGGRGRAEHRPAGLQLAVPSSGPSLGYTEGLVRVGCPIQYCTHHP